MRRGRPRQELGKLGWYVFGIVDDSNIGFVDTTNCCAFITILALPLLRDWTRNPQLRIRSTSPNCQNSTCTFQPRTKAFRTELVVEIGSGIPPVAEQMQRCIGGRVAWRQYLPLPCQRIRSAAGVGLLRASWLPGGRKAENQRGCHH